MAVLHNMDLHWVGGHKRSHRIYECSQEKNLTDCNHNDQDNKIRQPGSLTRYMLSRGCRAFSAAVLQQPAAVELQFSVVIQHLSRAAWLRSAP